MRAIGREGDRGTGPGLSHVLALHGTVTSISAMASLAWLCSFSKWVRVTRGPWSHSQARSCLLHVASRRAIPRAVKRNGGAAMLLSRLGCHRHSRGRASVRRGLAGTLQVRLGALKAHLQAIKDALDGDGVRDLPEEEARRSFWRRGLSRTSRAKHAFAIVAALQASSPCTLPRARPRRRWLFTQTSSTLSARNLRKRAAFF